MKLFKKLFDRICNGCFRGHSDSKDGSWQDTGKQSWKVACGCAGTVGSCGVAAGCYSVSGGRLIQPVLVFQVLDGRS